MLVPQERVTIFYAQDCGNLVELGTCSATPEAILEARKKFIRLFQLPWSCTFLIKQTFTK